jgi:hypothetical protein
MGIADAVARVGPTTPARARRLFDASVDPTDARNATVGSECRLSFFPADYSLRWWRGIIKG